MALVSIRYTVFNINDVAIPKINFEHPVAASEKDQLLPTLVSITDFSRDERQNKVYSVLRTENME